MSNRIKIYLTLYEYTDHQKENPEKLTRCNFRYTIITNGTQ